MFPYVYIERGHLQLIANKKDGCFIDSQGRERFPITAFVQPKHPIIQKLARGKTIVQLSQFWRDNYTYDKCPPFRLLNGCGRYVLECEDNFSPRTLIDYIAQAKTADCWGGSCFLASLMVSQGYKAKVCLGSLRRPTDDSLVGYHAWVEIVIPEQAVPTKVNVFGNEVDKK